MIFLFFLFDFSFCRALISEFTEFSREYVGETVFAPSELYTPNSKYAFITSLTADDDKYREIMKTIVLGYNLLSVAPRFDRILLISDNFQTFYEAEERLGRFFTHVYRTPYIRFPCNMTQMNSKDKHFWFKINSWTITNYKALLWVGRDTFFIKDPSSIFSFLPPASTADNQIWNISEFGVVHNTDFLLFKPSLSDFVKIKQLGCKWVEDPEFGPRDSQSPNIGAYDNGLLEHYFAGNIVTLPKIWNFEVNETTNKEELLNPEIISYRFTQSCPPWSLSNSIISKSWLVLAKEAYKEFGISIQSFFPRIVIPEYNESFQAYFENGKEFKGYTYEDLYSTFIELYSISNIRIIILSICIFLLSLGLVVLGLF